MPLWIGWNTSSERQKAELEKAMENGLLTEANRKKIEAKLSAVE